MNRFTRPVSVALSIGLPAFLASAISFAQQAEAPPQQPYPQTPYSQPGASSPQGAPSPYPVTGQSSQLSATDPQPPATSDPPANAPAANAPPQAPPGFQLNALQQTQLDAVLDAWQTSSATVKTFTCKFERLEYVMAFGPVINGQPAPLNKDLGELTYSKPDKGSFQITEISTYTKIPPPADQPNAPARADWVKQPNAIGEHWACDGKAVYEFRADQKQVIERPIPPQMQGQSIVDGPLPFLFGAEKDKLKARYWMRTDQKEDPKQIWLTALPKFQEQAADFRQVEVILDRDQQLPQAMRVTLPNGDQHVYKFDLNTASKNGILNQIQQALFQKPHTPVGWKHVVEQPPVAQAAQPAQAQTR